MQRVISILTIFLTLFLFSFCDSTVEPDDTYPPTVMLTFPVNDAVDVNINIDSIAIQFTEKIQMASNNKINLNGLSVNAIVAGRKLVIKNNGLEASTTYTLIIPAKTISDAVGNFATEIEISFTTIEAQEPVTISPNLVTNNPSAQAVKLYNFLKENYGVKIISSTMANVNWNINEAEWVKLHTGKYPAMATFDYIHLMSSPASWIDYSNTSVVEDWWNNNGIVSACWHWNVPVSQGSLTFTYKPEETTFNPSNATIEGTWENDVVKADLAKIAVYLKLLQEKNIPVIWRPLHEAAGNTYEYSGGKAWFWWGSGGASAFKNLWKYMFDYFNAQGLNNLIWVWTTQTKDNAYYPGDNYVDIVGRDIYNKASVSAIASEFNSIQQTYPTKMVTLSEFGNVAKISEQWIGGAKWSYFMPWYDYNRTNSMTDSDFSSTEHEHANAAWWNDAVNAASVITRDKMPSLK
ncbi:MAG: glycosyl hydrolase [Paludibacter sp.]|nr:glycosyl hydrolase [Paludibacter sp.]